MKATGANTATIEKVVAATAMAISLVPSCEAWTWSLPISTCRTMFSRTTMASSIRIPIASDRPSSDMVLRVNPQAQTAMKEESAETGRARPVITVERQELRKRKTTKTVSNAPSISASSTFLTDWRTRSPASRTVSIRTPCGRGGSRLGVRAPGGADPFRFGDVDAHRHLAVVEGEGALLGRAVPHVGHLRQADELAVV